MNFRVTPRFSHLLRAFAVLFFLVFTAQVSSLDDSNHFGSDPPSAGQLVQVRHAEPGHVEMDLIHSFEDRVAVKGGRPQVRHKRQVSISSTPDANGKCGRGCVVDRRRKTCSCRRRQTRKGR